MQPGTTAATIYSPMLAVSSRADAALGSRPQSMPPTVTQPCVNIAGMNSPRVLSSSANGTISGAQTPSMPSMPSAVPLIVAGASPRDQVRTAKTLGVTVEGRWLPAGCPQGLEQQQQQQQRVQSAERTVRVSSVAAAARVRSPQDLRCQSAGRDRGIGITSMQADPALPSTPRCTRRRPSFASAKLNRRQVSSREVLSPCPDVSSKQRLVSSRSILSPGSDVNCKQSSHDGWSALEDRVAKLEKIFDGRAMEERLTLKMEERFAQQQREMHHSFVQSLRAASEQVMELQQELLKTLVELDIKVEALGAGPTCRQEAKLRDADKMMSTVLNKLEELNASCVAQFVGRQLQPKLDMSAVDGRLAACFRNSHTSIGPDDLPHEQMCRTSCNIQDDANEIVQDLRVQKCSSDKDVQNVQTVIKETLQMSDNLSQQVARECCEQSTDLSGFSASSSAPDGSGQTIGWEPIDTHAGHESDSSRGVVLDTRATSPSLLSGSTQTLQLD